MLSPEFSDKFGFTEEETQDLLAELGRNRDLPSVREWYNGHQFGETVIYNPWSILNFAASREDYCKPYWINSSSNDLIRDLILNGDRELHGELERLLNGETVLSSLNEYVTLRDVDKSLETVLSFFVHCGYLKVTDRRQEGLGQLYSLAVPNLETMAFYKDVISGWMKENVGNQRLRQMLSALTSGDWKTFGKYLRDMVADVLSVHDVAGEKPERVYHAFVLGLLVATGDRYRIRSNRESGYGRHDVLMAPKEPSEMGLVLEFKKIEHDENEDSEKALSSALAQIREKDYAAELRAMGAKRAMGIGVAFEGKRVFVRGADLF